MAIQIAPLAPSTPPTTGIQDPAARQFANAVADILRTAQSPEYAVQQMSRAAGAMSGGSVPPSIATWLFSSELHRSLTRAIEAVDIGAKQAIVAEAVARAAAISQVALDAANALTDAITAEAAARGAAILAEAEARAAGLLEESGERTAAIAAEAATRAAAIVAEQTARAAAIANEVVLRDAAIAVEARDRINAVAAEASVRAAAVLTERDARIAAISTEQAARAAALLAEATARGTAITEEATLRTAGDDQLASQITTVTASVADNAAAIQAEQTARATADDAIAATATALAATVEGYNTTQTAAITTEATARAGADTALSTQITTLTATVTGNAADTSALIAAEQTARADADSALATRLDIVAASADSVRAATAAMVVSEVTARADADIAIAQEITTLQAVVDDNTAAIQTESTARATADAAEAVQRNLLAAQFRGDYTGSDVNAVTEGLLYQERIARADADTGLAQQITLLSAGAGEQFDYAKIFYFDTGVESWTGNGTPVATGGWLRPADHGSDPYVDSPAGLAIAGATHEQVRLRVRKFGAPTWDGFIWWRAAADGTWDAGRRVALVEPTYDANGIGLVTVSTGWTGTIDRIRVDLSSAQSATDRYEIDWVAIGRPAPGASTAALLAEQSARATADSAEVTARQALAAKLTGLNDPSAATLGTLASGLIYDEKVARTTQDTALSTSISSLQATVTTNNTTQTAAVTTEATARAAADASLASQISSVSATASGKNKVFVQASAPTATSTNDLWLDSDDGNKLYRWSGSAWVVADDARIAANAAAIVTEQTARANADTAEATARETLAAQMRGTYTGTDIASVTTGLIYSERQARVSADAAEVVARETLAATVTTNDTNQTAAVTAEATARANADSALSTTLDALTATVTGNNSALSGLISTEQAVRADADEALSLRIDVVAATADTVRAATAAMVVTEITTRATETEALAQEISTLQAAVTTGDSATAALVVSEATARATEDAALSTRIDTVVSTANTDRADAAAGVTSEATARAAGDAAEATQREALATQMRGAYTGTDVASLTTGLIYSERQARSTADASEVTARQALSAKLTGVNDPASKTLATLSSGLLYDERQARVTADSAQVSRLDGLEATVNHPTTGVSATSSALDVVELAVNHASTGNTALGTRASTLESAINHPTTGLATKASTAYVNTTVATETSARAAALALIQAEVDANEAAVLSESTTRATEDESIASRIDVVSASADAIRFATAALAVSETVARATQDAAFVTRFDAIEATVDDNTAAITDEATVRADAVSALTTQINTVSSVANGRNRTFRQASAPTGAVTGDLWLDSDDANKAYRYDGASWVATSDTRIASNEAAIVAEAATRATNDDALVEAINTAWAVTGATQALIQSGGTIQTNWTAGQASQWTQLQAEVFGAGGNTIRAALAAEASVRANVDGGLSAQWTLKTDLDGYISGFGFASTANNAEPTSEFIIRADKFAMVMPGYGEHVPFAIGAFGPEFTGLTNWAGVQGAGKPADNATVGATIGTNLSGQIDASNVTTYIANGAIGAAQIGSINLVGNFNVKSATLGARMEMDAERIDVYDASGVLRVRLGKLT